MRVLSSLTIALMMAGLLSACSGTPVRSESTVQAAQAVIPPGLDPQSFGEPLATPTSEALFTLTEAQQKHFLDYFDDPRYADVRPHQRLFDYLENRLTGFRYYGATRTAADALSSGEGNCLSLAILTTALARLADIPIEYRRLSDEPVYERQSNVVLVADHVRSVLFDPDYLPGQDAEPHTPQSLVIDYFPDRRRSKTGGKVSGPTLQSMFYTNLAGEAMASQQNRKVFWLLKAALRDDPDNIGAFNSLAVLHRRMGNDRTAESVYRYALDRYGDSPNLLSNYRNLLLAQGRQAEVADLDRRLALLPTHNPYDLIELGNYAFLNGRPQQALDLYSRALDQAPYLHEAYWRQAVVYQSLGQREKAENLLLTASTLAGRTQDKHLYQAKLLSVREPVSH